MVIAKARNRDFLPPPATIIRLVMVGLFDAVMVWLIAQLASDGSYPLAAILSTIIPVITISFSLDQFRPYRWLAVGLSLTILFVLYPIFYTLFISTTNTSESHILTQQLAVERLQNVQYIPEDGLEFSWTAFQSEGGEFALWLQAEDGSARLVKVGETLGNPTPGSDGIGELDEDGIPVSIEGYRRLERRDVVALINQLGTLEFGEPPATIKVQSLSSAATTEQRYIYDEQQNVITDLETGALYHSENGTFVSDAGDELRPGFFVGVGLGNFDRFFTSSAMRGPLAQIIAWNFAYAILSVLFSFALGLFIALMFDNLPGRNIIRTLLIIPYPIPALVSILIWRNLLNPDFGALVNLQESLFGSKTNWLTDPMATRAAIILINMWLSYPYFYIVSSGALQAIPSEMLDAAAVDGANLWQRFWRITLPLLLVIVSPLLVASFGFNFNNFNLIYIFNQGNPPIAGAPIPAGHTDILISFVYKLAFSSGSSDYGLASAISIVLFVFVALITWMQFRYTRILEDRA